ncbi:MAG: acylphosphatase [Pseudomonadota bacterium]
MSAAKSVQVAIFGRVQGVGYRAWVRDEALARGLTGWVRNRKTGEVEAVFSGHAQTVDAMVTACHRGPDWAKVERVEFLPDAVPVPAGFEILRTV